MLNMKEIANYGPCYILSCVCPADGIDLPRKATLFDVCNGATHETLGVFRTGKQAKKFAHRYIADPEGTIVPLHGEAAGAHRDAVLRVPQFRVSAQTAHDSNSVQHNQPSNFGFFHVAPARLKTWGATRPCAVTRWASGRR